MPEVEPITREEKLWSGENIEPITREEQYIKHIFDKTQNIPSKPITRKEMLLEKAGEGGGSDVTIKQLSVTANGTYSEEGTAYSPVIVNVPTPPIPDNAYLLNEVEGLPKDIVTFNDGESLPMPSLKVGIEPIQEGSGYPSPENIRHISGFTEANVTRCGANLLDESNLTPYYIDTDGTLVSNDSYRVTDYLDFSNVNSIKYGITKATAGGWFYRIACYDSNKAFIALAVNRTLGNGVYTGEADMPNNTKYIRVCYVYSSSDRYIYNKATYNIYNIEFKDGSNPLTVYSGTLDVINGIVTPCPYYASYNGEQLIGEWISDRDVYSPNTSPTIGAQVVNIGTIGTPFSVQPSSVKSLLGSNNVWADTGDIEELEYFIKEA